MIGILIFGVAFSVFLGWMAYELKTAPEVDDNDNSIEDKDKQ